MQNHNDLCKPNKAWFCYSVKLSIQAILLASYFSLEIWAHYSFPNFYLYCDIKNTNIFVFKFVNDLAFCLDNHINISSCNLLTLCPLYFTIEKVGLF